MKRFLGIYGSGGLGREVYDLCMRINAHDKKWDQVYFIDDFDQSAEFYGSEKKNLEDFCSLDGDKECVIAVGEPSVRQKLFERAKNMRLRFPTLIDPTAIVSSSATLSQGCIVFEFSSIKANVTLSENVLVQPYVDLGHDISSGPHSVFSPYCSPGGSSVFGARVFAGMKSTILEKLTIHDDAVIGMGAVVYRDVEVATTVLGNPARPTKPNNSGKVFK